MSGFHDGTILDKDEMVAFLKKAKTRDWDFVVAHSTAAPDMKQARDTPYRQGNKMLPGPDKRKAYAQRMRNFLGDINSRLRGVGWHFTVFEGGLFGVGERLTTFSHAHSSWNEEGIAVEICMNGDGRDLDTVAGKQLVEDAAWLFARLLDKIGKAPTVETVRLHRDETSAKRRGKTCPGAKFDGRAFLTLIKSYGAPKPTGGAQAILVDTVGSVAELQTELKRVGLYAGAVDGYLGPLTDKALALFQVIMGVKPGPLGPWTWKKLLAYPTPATVLPPATAPMSTAAAAVELLMANGLTRVQAAGVVGNLQRESYPSLKSEVAGDYMINGKPVRSTTPGATPSAFGIGQWRNERKAALDKFAASRGVTWTDREAQVLFVLHELKTTETLAGLWLPQAKTVEQATAAMVCYERPKGYISARAKAASAWMDLMLVAEACDGWKERLAFAKALV